MRVFGGRPDPSRLVHVPHTVPDVHNLLSTLILKLFPSTPLSNLVTLPLALVYLIARDPVYRDPHYFIHFPLDFTRYLARDDLCMPSLAFSYSEL